MQLQIPGGDRAGAFNVCITKVEPVAGGSTGTGGSGGGTVQLRDARAAPARITAQFGDAHVMCPKDYIVQNNAWGSTAGQTITFGPGTKFKVTVAEREPHRQLDARRLPVDLHGRVQQPQHDAAAACRARSARSPRAASRPASPGPTTARTGSYNAAYDVWFSTGSGGDPTARRPAAAT